jgi:hypothetical protein
LDEGAQLVVGANPLAPFAFDHSSLPEGYAGTAQRDPAKKARRRLYAAAK